MIAPEPRGKPDATWDHVDPSRVYRGKFMQAPAPEPREGQQEQEPIDFTDEAARQAADQLIPATYTETLMTDFPVGRLVTTVREPREGQQERTTDEKLKQLRNAVKRQGEAHGEPVGIMVGPDNFLAQMGIGSLEGAEIIVHEGCTIISLDNSTRDVAIAGSRVWISSLSAVREAAGLDDTDDDWYDADDDTWLSS